MKLRNLLYLLVFFSFSNYSCSDQQEVVTKASAELVEESRGFSNNKGSNSPNKFASYFDTETQNTINTIKTDFENGISDDFDFSARIGKAYEYNARTIRADVFNKIPYTLTFPYDGTFAIEKFVDVLSNIPFLTNKCGFQDEKNDKIIHYYCINLNDRFFEYLAELGKNNSFIDAFRLDYQKHKSLTPNLRQQLMMQTEELDFDNYDHQVIYMLLHIAANEERMAAKKLKTTQ